MDFPYADDLSSAIIDGKRPTAKQMGFDPMTAAVRILLAGKFLHEFQDMQRSDTSQVLLSPSDGPDYAASELPRRRPALSEPAVGTDTLVWSNSMVEKSAAAAVQAHPSAASAYGTSLQASTTCHNEGSRKLSDHPGPLLSIRAPTMQRLDGLAEQPQSQARHLGIGRNLPEDRNSGPPKPGPLDATLASRPQPGPRVPVPQRCLEFAAEDTAVVMPATDLSFGVMRTRGREASSPGSNKGTAAQSPVAGATDKSKAFTDGLHRPGRNGLPQGDSQGDRLLAELQLGGAQWSPSVVLGALGRGGAACDTAVRAGSPASSVPTHASSEAGPDVAEGGAASGVTRWRHGAGDDGSGGDGGGGGSGGDHDGGASGVAGNRRSGGSAERGAGGAGISVGDNRSGGGAEGGSTRGRGGDARGSSGSCSAVLGPDASVKAAGGGSGSGDCILSDEALFSRCDQLGHSGELVALGRQLVSRLARVQSTKAQVLKMEEVLLREVRVVRSALLEAMAQSKDGSMLPGAAAATDVDITEGAAAAATRGASPGARTKSPTSTAPSDVARPTAAPGLAVQPHQAAPQPPPPPPPPRPPLERSFVLPYASPSAPPSSTCQPPPLKSQRIQPPSPRPPSQPPSPRPGSGPQPPISQPRGTPPSPPDPQTAQPGSPSPQAPHPPPQPQARVQVQQQPQPQPQRLKQTGAALTLASRAVMTGVPALLPPSTGAQRPKQQQQQCLGKEVSDAKGPFELHLTSRPPVAPLAGTKRPIPETFPQSPPPPSFTIRGSPAARRSPGGGGAPPIPIPVLQTPTSATTTAAAKGAAASVLDKAANSGGGGGLGIPAALLAAPLDTETLLQLGPDVLQMLLAAVESGIKSRLQHNDDPPRPNAGLERLSTVAAAKLAGGGVGLQGPAGLLPAGGSPRNSQLSPLPSLSPPQQLHPQHHLLGSGHQHQQQQQQQQQQQVQHVHAGTVVQGRNLNQQPGLLAAQHQGRPVAQAQGRPAAARGDGCVALQAAAPPPPPAAVMGGAAEDAPVCGKKRRL